MRIPCDILVPPKAISRQIRVPIFFSCFGLGIGAWLYFLIDTGAGRSLLSERDARILGIDYGRLELQEDPLVGLGGTSLVYKIKDECKLTLLDSDHKPHVENFSEFGATKIELDDPKKRQLVFNLIPSLIGMDLLEKYKLVATAHYAYLEQ